MTTNNCGANDPSTCRYHGTAAYKNHLNAQAAQALQSGDTSKYLELKEKIAALKPVPEKLSSEALEAQKVFIRTIPNWASLTKDGDKEYSIKDNDELQVLSDSLEDEEVEVEWDKPVPGYDVLRSIRIVETDVVIENRSYTDEIQDVATPGEIRDYLWTD